MAKRLVFYSNKIIDDMQTHNSNANNAREFAHLVEGLTMLKAIEYPSDEHEGVKMTIMEPQAERIPKNKKSKPDSPIFGYIAIG
ncbi:hypothetical protein ACOME3_004281 [Neoechinorhynchus agilis]